MMRCACWRQPTALQWSAARTTAQWASGDAHCAPPARAEPAASSSRSSRSSRQGHSLPAHRQQDM